MRVLISPTILTSRGHDFITRVYFLTTRGGTIAIDKKRRDTIDKRSIDYVSYKISSACIVFNLRRVSERVFAAGRKRDEK